jgi:hypothetical protein
MTNCHLLRMGRQLRAPLFINAVGLPQSRTISCMIVARRIQPTTSDLPMATIPDDISTHLAWQFESVLPGHFRRNKEDYAHIAFPILSPLPPHNSATKPLEGATLTGPFIYFVLNRRGEVCYVGKSKERTVIKRWVRPGSGGPATHYWTHTNESAGCVRRIANGILAGDGPFQLRFVPVNSLPSTYMKRFEALHPHLDPLERIERGMMSVVRPLWNGI